MARIESEVCEVQLSGLPEAMDLLEIDVETDVVEEKQGREDATFSVSLITEPSLKKKKKKFFLSWHWCPS